MHMKAIIIMNKMREKKKTPFNTISAQFDQRQHTRESWIVDASTSLLLYLF